MALINVVMAAKRLHNLLSASWRTRKVSGVIQSKSEVLRDSGLLV